MEESRLEKHISILGVLYIALGAFGLLIALLVFLAVFGGGLITADLFVISITSTVAMVIAICGLVITAPAIIAGVGLLTRKAWARPLALIVGALNLLNPPFGTALGLYTFWALLQDESKLVLRARSV